MMRRLCRIEDDLLRWLALWLASPWIFGHLLVIALWRNPTSVFDPIFYRFSWLLFVAMLDGDFVGIK